MPITIVSTTKSSGQPSAPQRVAKVVATLDASYPTGGYPLTAALPPDSTVVASPAVPIYNGTTLRWAKVSSVGLLQVFANTGGAPGAEVSAATDLSLYTSIEVIAHVE